ncbi:MAG: HD-GYP domain-containing protein [Firmicutes bacterium]|nr:HD-GYP domain-containing protein [Bacillota bacterium]
MRLNLELAKNIVDIFPGDLRDHSYNVYFLSVRLAEYVGYKSESLQNLAIGALLHDIGKTEIDQKIINKPGKLTEEEFAIVKKHTVIGSDLVKSFKGNQNVLPVVLYHHERWDGTGYERLKENEIPESAQIVTIADAFDAMTTNRPYQKIKTLAETLQELSKNKGLQFSPTLVEKFEELIIEHTKKASSHF